MRVLLMQMRCLVIAIQFEHLHYIGTYTVGNLEKNTITDTKGIQINTHI